MELVTTLKHKYNAFKNIFLKNLAFFFLELAFFFLKKKKKILNVFPEILLILRSLFHSFLLSCFDRLSQKLTRKGWSPGSSRSSNCSACSLGKLCWTCLGTVRKGECAVLLLPLIFLFSRRAVTPVYCNSAFVSVIC